MKKGYFDNAATTLIKPQGMYQYVADYMLNYGSNVSRGEYAMAKSAGKIVRETRDLLLDLLQAPKTKEVVFTPSATIALNIIINGQDLDVDDIVYISPFEHNAVIRTLFALQKFKRFQIRYIKLKENILEYDLDGIKTQFEEMPPTLVILSHVSNVIGLIAPVMEIAQITKKYQGTIIVDGAQACGLIDVEVNHYIDYYVFAGHKTLYAPFGIAGFVCNKNTSLQPYILGGTGVDSASIEMPNTIPERFEAGSPNLMAIAGLNYSLLWIKNNQSWVKHKEKENFRLLKGILQKYSFIKVVEVAGEVSSIVSCKVDGFTSDEVGRILAERDVSVRTGLHCAPLAHKQIGSFPEGLVRFSISCFTDADDFKVLEAALDYIEENS